MDKRPVEMQYSTRYLPPALYAPGSHAGNLQSDSIGNFYNMNPREYESMAQDNPYNDHYEPIDDLCHEISPDFSAMHTQSMLANSQRIREMVCADNMDLSDSSFPPRDEDLRALIPEGLNWTVQTGHEFQPHLMTPEHSRRPLSQAASVYEVKSPFSVTAQVVKSSSQSSTESPDKSSPRSLTTIDEDGSSESSPISREGTKSQRGSVHKKLFGNNGWLDDPKSKQTLRRRPSVMRELGRKIKELTVETPRVYKISSPTTGLKLLTVSHCSAAPISLTTNQQSRLYAELEVMICTSANDFIMDQYYDGRISQQSIERVHEFWAAKNRPRVTEFRYDQATQRDLIIANRRSLRFTGESSNNPIMLESNLSNWRTIAKEMNVRTFCLPDSVIRKHLHDTRNILDMLNASLPTLQHFRNLSFQAQDEMMKGSVQCRPRTVSGNNFSKQSLI